MNLKEFNFPEMSAVDMAFSTNDTIPELLEEATKRGFDRMSNKYNKLFNTLFFTGGEINFKPDLEEWQKKMWLYCRSFMSSFAPKHEHKEAICAMLMSEVLEIK